MQNASQSASSYSEPSNGGHKEMRLHSAPYKSVWWRRFTHMRMRSGIHRRYSVFAGPQSWLQRNSETVTRWISKGIQHPDHCMFSFLEWLSLRTTLCFVLVLPFCFAEIRFPMIETFLYKPQPKRNWQTTNSLAWTQSENPRKQMMPGSAQGTFHCSRFEPSLSRAVHSFCFREEHEEITLKVSYA